MGWFYGFKLHLVINDKGEILDSLFNQGNVDDIYSLKNKSFHNKILGRLLQIKAISLKVFLRIFLSMGFI